MNNYNKEISQLINMFEVIYVTMHPTIEILVEK